jgi:hypothetical protein
MDDVIQYLSSLEAGYNTKFANLEAADSSTNALLSSLVSTTGGHTAAIASLDTTKIDATSALAIAQDTVSSYFADGSAGAFFDSKISTYASDVEANASNTSVLGATLGDVSARVTTADTVANQALEWSASASKLITAPDGSITGWEFSDGSNQVSDFKIKATNFSISDGTTGYTPFSISGSNINFNGVVDFTNTNTFGTTTIDGSKITTGTITADQIAAGSITADYMQSNDFTTIGGAGFRLKANAAGTSADPTIYGAYISAGKMVASNIIIGGSNGTKYYDAESGYELDSAASSGIALTSNVSNPYGGTYAVDYIYFSTNYTPYSAAPLYLWGPGNHANVPMNQRVRSTTGSSQISVSISVVAQIHRVLSIWKRDSVNGTWRICGRQSDNPEGAWDTVSSIWSEKIDMPYDGWVQYGIAPYLSNGTLWGGAEPYVYYPVVVIQALNI